MSLTEIRASFHCDECGVPFSVAIDPARKAPQGWSMYEMGEDAVRGSLDYKGPDDRDDGTSSVQDDKHLCGPCTGKADRAEEGGRRDE